MIEIKDAVSGYGKKTVINKLSLEIEKGGVLSIIGPNGSGKSTLLKTVAGVIPLTGGEIFIDGVNASTLSRRARALKTAYLPQESAVPDMTAFESVLQGRYPHVGIFSGYTKQERCVAERIINEMGLSSVANQKMSELSGGMRRRVHIASALAEESDYILLDEPCAYLDVGTQLEMMRLLKGLAQTDKGIVLVCHDLPLAFNLSDKIAVLDEGCLLMCDTPERVFQSGIAGNVFGVGLLKNDDVYSLSYKPIK